MIDRVDELLDFDLALVASIVEGGSRPAPEEGDGPLPDLRGSAGPLRFVGFDEAGRGALAGPVAVGCVHVDLSGGEAGRARETIAEALAGLDDSKRLPLRRRETLYQAIVSIADWGLGCASASEIDRLGIVGACRRAARRAYAKLTAAVNVGLFDRGLSLVAEDATARLPEVRLTRGDARSLHVAAASVIAKVGRDAIMERLGERFP